MKDSIESVIGGNRIMVAVVSESEYAEALKKIVSAVAKIEGKVCYVSLNKPYGTLLKAFEESKIDTTGFVFIDAVSGGVRKAEDANVVFVSSPKALTELSIGITESMSSSRAVILDSLSTLLLYGDPSAVIKFAHFIISRARRTEKRLVFTILGHDAQSTAIKDLGMFVDKIIEIK